MITYHLTPININQFNIAKVIEVQGWFCPIWDYAYISFATLNWSVYYANRPVATHHLRKHSDLNFLDLRSITLLSTTSNFAAFPRPFQKHCGLTLYRAGAVLSEKGGQKRLSRARGLGNKPPFKHYIMLVAGSTWRCLTTRRYYGLDWVVQGLHVACRDYRRLHCM